MFEPAIVGATVVTRSPRNQHPIIRPQSNAVGKMAKTKEEHLIGLADGVVITEWLNRARDSKIESFNRIVCLYRTLDELRRVRVDLKARFGPCPEASAEARRQLADAKKMRGSTNIPIEVRFPGDRNDDTPEGRAEYSSLLERIRALAGKADEQLRRYSYRPHVQYLREPGSIPVLDDEWAGCMVPDQPEDSYETNIGGWPVSEADAAISLVRLDLGGALNRVMLCGRCQTRWFMARKGNRKFCSDVCREAFYLRSPEYKPRKKNTQAKYRNNLKAKHANEDREYAKAKAGERSKTRTTLSMRT